MQAVSASVRTDRQAPSIVQQPYLSTWPTGLSSPVKCHAPKIELGTPPAPDHLCYRSFISRITCRICLGTLSAHEGAVRMPVGLC